MGAATPATLTTSAMPSCIGMSTLAVWPDSSRMGLVSKAWKRGACARTRYVPIGSAEMVYRPRSLLRALYATWVAWLAATTSTSGIGLPSRLLTAPVKLAKWIWASTGTEASSTTDGRTSARSQLVFSSHRLTSRWTQSAPAAF